MIKIESWSQATASEEFKKRLDQAKKARVSEEDQWRVNEATVYNTTPAPDQNVGIDDLTGLQLGSEGGQDAAININYTFNYVRFLHAQLSSNPPTSVPVPTSQELKDRQAARVAEHLIQHGRREYEVQEFQDATTLDTMIYGSGWGRCSWSPTKGEIRKIEGDKAIMQGDFDISTPSVWDVWLDPEASCWRDVRYVFVRHYITLEEALAKWPQHKQELTTLTTKQKKDRFFDSALAPDEYDSTLVELYEYIEKKLPWNGMKGRYVWGIESGLLLTDINVNPFTSHEIPLRILTDIDIPHRVYGKSIVSYLARGQEVLAALDSTILDNIQAHGVVRLVLPDGAKINDEGLTNNGWEYVEVAGNAGGAPFFMNPPTLMPDIYRFRDQLIVGLQTIAGINENMLGQQSREMSGYSMQTAINAGNMVRRRLFNKYTGFVNWFWNTYLSTIQQEWTSKKQIVVVGQEDARSVKSFSGADIEGGFDLQTDYGTNFSLDPERRQEQIMQLSPLMEKAGMSQKKILEKLQLSDVKGVFDIMDLARKRQIEVFEEMIDKYEGGAPVYIAPEELEEHKGMLDAAYEFVMLRRYKDLEDGIKQLIVRHVKEREQLAQPPAAAAMAPPAPGGMPAMPPGLPM